MDEAIDAAIAAAPSYWLRGDAQKDHEREQFGKVVRAALGAFTTPHASTHAFTALYEALTKVRDACLYTDDDASGDYIAVTTDPHISEELFSELCAALSLARSGRDGNE